MKKIHKERDERQAWIKFSGNFELTTGCSWTRLWKIFDKWKLDNTPRKPEEWIIEFELLGGDLQKTDVQIDNS